MDKDTHVVTPSKLKDALSSFLANITSKFVSKSGDTITGNLQIGTTSSKRCDFLIASSAKAIDGAVHLYGDEEGGNISIKSPSGYVTEFDRYNDTECRCYSFDEDGNYHSVRWDAGSDYDLNNLNKIANPWIYSSSVTCEAGKTTTVFSTTVPAGTWLMLGNFEVNFDGTGLMYASLSANSTRIARGTENSGGGCNVFNIEKLTESTAISMKVCSATGGTGKALMALIHLN